MAFTGLLKASFRQSRRRTVLFLETVFGLPCSTGLTVKQQTLVTRDVRPAYEQLVAALPAQSHVSADETPTKELFRQWSRCRDGTIPRRGLKRLLAPVRRTVEGLLLRGRATGAASMCRELHQHRDRLWAFLDQEGVEPTNNAAERSLRHAVIWRKHFLTGRAGLRDAEFRRQPVRGDAAERD